MASGGDPSQDLLSILRDPRDSHPGRPMRVLVKKSTSEDARRHDLCGRDPGDRGRPQERATGLLIWGAPGRILCGPGGIFWNPSGILMPNPYPWVEPCLLGISLALEGSLWSRGGPDRRL